MTTRYIAACVLLLGIGPALAETLPLRHGAYVGVGTDCTNPRNVELRTYDGGGLGSSKANDCRAGFCTSRETCSKLSRIAANSAARKSRVAPNAPPSGSTGRPLHGHDGRRQRELSLMPRRLKP